MAPQILTSRVSTFCLQGYWEYLTHDSGDWRKV
jgi:hypothetical protein